MIKFLICLSSLASTAASVYKSFRRDKYLPQALYPERWCEIPLEGGRIHFVGESSLTSETSPQVVYPLNVDLGWFSVVVADTTDPDSFPDGLDWIYASYNDQTRQYWVSLHAHHDAFLANITKLKVTDASGTVLIDDTAAVDPLADESDLQITYVTSRNNFQELVVHIHNYGSVVTLSSIIVNGISFQEELTISKGEHAVRTYSLRDFKFTEVSVWTAALLLVDGSPAVGYGGSLIKENYVMEDWPKGEQCPFDAEGANRTNFQLLSSELHLDTHFFGGACAASISSVLQAALDSQSTSKPWFLLPDESKSDGSKNDLITPEHYPGIAALFIGDESDSSLEAAGVMWQSALQRRRLHPGIAQYIGGHSNHLNGAFAGIAEIQGMDFYVAACAPHVTGTLHPIALRGAYDYLRLARDNHKPLTTWSYSQAYCADCWIMTPNGNEIVVQMAAVVAAGAKGMMLFQSDVSLQGTEEWTMGSNFLASIDLIRPILRVSDVEGAKLVTSDGAINGRMSLIEVLRSPDQQLILVTANMNAQNYSDVFCVLREKGPKSHWIFEEHVIESISVDIPSDMLKLSQNSLADSYKVHEVINGSYEDLTDVQSTFDETQGRWVISNLKLDGSKYISRIFVLLPA